MLDAGDPAPDFTLPAADGSGRYMLSAAARSGPVVLAFTPANADRAADLFEGLAAMDWAALADRIAVFAVVPDGSTAAGLPELPFPVLVDDGGYVADLYGVPASPRGESGGGPRRALVLSDPDCTIRYRWVAGDATADSPLAALAGAVRALR